MQGTLHDGSMFSAEKSGGQAVSYLGEVYLKIGGDAMADSIFQSIVNNYLTHFGRNNFKDYAISETINKLLGDMYRTYSLENKDITDEQGLYNLISLCDYKDFKFKSHGLSYLMNIKNLLDIFTLSKCKTIYEIYNFVNNRKKEGWKLEILYHDAILSIDDKVIYRFDSIKKYKFRKTSSFKELALNYCYHLTINNYKYHDERLSLLAMLDDANNEYIFEILSKIKAKGMKKKLRNLYLLAQVNTEKELLRIVKKLKLNVHKVNSSFSINMGKYYIGIIHIE